VRESSPPRTGAWCWWRAGSDSPPAHRALETLWAHCRFTIYVYVQRKGYGPDETQDVTQDYFAQLLAKGRVGLGIKGSANLRF